MLERREGGSGVQGRGGVPGPGGAAADKAGAGVPRTAAGEDD